MENKEWELQIKWKEGTTPEERIETESFIFEVFEDLEQGAERIPTCVEAFTFSKN